MRLAMASVDGRIFAGLANISRRRTRVEVGFRDQIILGATVIHRASRHQLALALRRYASRRLTYDELDSASVDWRDRGAVAVKQMEWHLYDDLQTHQ